MDVSKVTSQQKLSTTLTLNKSCPRTYSAPCKTASTSFHNRSRRTFKVQAAPLQTSLHVNGLQPTSPKAWEFVSGKLREQKVKLISQQELLFAQQDGTPVVDIRPQGDFQQAHIKGSKNVALFRLITGWSPMKVARRMAFAFFGVFKEVNPAFDDELVSVAPKDKPIVVVCSQGGTLEPSLAFKAGKQSRSLMAAYELLRLGYTNVSVLKGGFSEWLRNGRPVVEVE